MTFDWVEKRIENSVEFCLLVVLNSNFLYICVIIWWIKIYMVQIQLWLSVYTVWYLFFKHLSLILVSEVSIPFAFILFSLTCILLIFIIISFTIFFLSECQYLMHMQFHIRWIWNYEIRKETKHWLCQCNSCTLWSMPDKLCMSVTLLDS